MNEINEKDLQQVSGGASQAEIDAKINAAFEEYRQKFCLSCENSKSVGLYHSCSMILHKSIENAIKEGKTPKPHCLKRR